MLGCEKTFPVYYGPINLDFPATIFRRLLTEPGGCTSNLSTNRMLRWSKSFRGIRVVMLFNFRELGQVRNREIILLGNSMLIWNHATFQEAPNGARVLLD